MPWHPCVGQKQAGQIQSVTTLTEVFGDSQKITVAMMVLETLFIKLPFCKNQQYFWSFYSAEICILGLNLNFHAISRNYYAKPEKRGYQTGNF